MCSGPSLLRVEQGLRQNQRCRVLPDAWYVDAPRMLARSEGITARADTNPGFAIELRRGE